MADHGFDKKLTSDQKEEFKAELGPLGATSPAPGMTETLEVALASLPVES